MATYFKNNMNLKELFTTFFLVNISLLLIIIIIKILMVQNNKKLESSIIANHKSFVIADELRYSSNELTKYCRAYVVTGDSIWEKKYWEVLDIRNGIKPRPNGRIIALKDSMVKLGFTRAEFEKLKKSEDNSNDLVWTERVAFQAMKGLFSDKEGNFSIQSTPDTVLARTIMFSNKYHSDKSIIMKPISDFIEMIDNRTQKEVTKYKNIGKWYFYTSIGLLILISLTTTVSFFIIKYKIIKQLESLIENQTRLKELNTTKDKLFTIIAHDLRSPFNSILGFSELLIENVKDFEIAETKNYLGFINTSSKNTLVLLDNLLNWAKSQTGQINFKPEKMDLSSIMQEALKISGSMAMAKNISLNYNPSDEIEVYADENMVKTILRNLISNAIKFTEQGGDIKILAVSEQNQVEISISDNGVGINETTRKKLFEISTSITSPGTANEQGSGLGLVLCKEFVEILGGDIWVESEEGKGSEFKFTLPLYTSV